MARDTKLIPENKTVYLQVDTFKCDKCGKELDEDYDELVPHELLILLNQERCVHQQFRRDYCTTCLRPIWLAICELIGADPDDLSRIDD